jgi:hypothetical protein
MSKESKKKTPAEMVAAGYDYKGKWVKVSDEDLVGQKKQFIKAMVKAKGHVIKAAKALDLKRSVFYRLTNRWPEIPWREQSYWRNKKTAKLKKQLKESLGLTDGHKTNAAKLMGCGIKEFNRMLALYPEVDWAKLYPKKSINNSQILKAEAFTVPQIFFVYYDHVLELGTKLRIATVVWAKSSKEAIRLVKAKVVEDNAWHRAQNFKTYVGHKNFRNAKYGPVEWSVIRNSAYPNIRQELIKLELAS